MLCCHREYIALKGNGMRETPRAGSSSRPRRIGKFGARGSTLVTNNALWGMCDFIECVLWGLTSLGSSGGVLIDRFKLTDLTDLRLFLPMHLSITALI